MRNFISKKTLFELSTLYVFLISSFIIMFSSISQKASNGYEGEFVDFKILVTIFLITAIYIFIIFLNNVKTKYI